MAVEMYVSKQTIRNFLSSGKTFLIPEYQRAYSWKEEQCETLWNDIVDFFENSKSNPEDEYFLGSIVGFIDTEKSETKQSKRNIFEIIDGQQRITTLNLLFRAFYEIVGKLQNKGEETKGYIKVFGKCIWSYDDGSETFDYDKRYLKSEVISDSDLEDLEKILSENYNKEKDNGDSLYNKNFRFLYARIEKYLNALDRRKDFYEVVLNRIVVLPIECNGKENAMRIFTTLNNRGLPLADSDIIKGKIYASKKSKDEKVQFANEWKKLEARLKNNEEENLNMDFLFIQYSHVTRARQGDSSKEIGLRRFYVDRYEKVLERENLLEELNELASLWLGEYDDKISLDSMQMFDVLKCYPNEYWRYLVSAYYFYCKDKKIDFFNDEYLLYFLRKIITILLVLFINKPTANVVKDPAFKLYANFSNLDKKDKSIQNILNSDDSSFKQNLFNVDRLTKALLKLNLYLKYPHQDTNIKAEIEHIFPKKWQDTNYNKWDKKDAEKYLEEIGNKMWLEKKLNIQAGNGYFGKKKEKYRNSRFLEAQELARCSRNDWIKGDIRERSEEIYQRLKKFFEENL